MAQLNRPNALWRCPQCGGDARWDDDIYEASFGDTSDAT